VERNTSRDNRHQSPIPPDGPDAKGGVHKLREVKTEPTGPKVENNSRKGKSGLYSGVKKRHFVTYQEMRPERRTASR